MKQNKSGIIWGLLLLIIGIVFLGNNMEFWDIDVFFKGWWALFIIIPSLIGLIKRNNIVSSTLGLIIGLLLLLAAQGIIKWAMIGQIFIPVLFIVIGISLIFKPLVKKKIKTDKKGIPSYTGIFSGCEEIAQKNFKGANCLAIFGGVELDLEESKITENVVINCTTLFGGIDLKVPKNINIKTSGMPIFGGVENHHKNPGEKEKTIVINYNAVFGGIEIK